MILLVEDNDDDVFLMKRALKKIPFSFPLNVAVNGREAIDYLQATGKFQDRNAYPLPNLILLDLMMPMINGFEVLAWIKQQAAFDKIPVVILTSSPEERDRKKAEELGAQKFLVKPPTPEMLQALFSTLLKN